MAHLGNGHGGGLKVQASGQLASVTGAKGLAHFLDDDGSCILVIFVHVHIFGGSLDHSHHDEVVAKILSLLHGRVNDEGLGWSVGIIFSRWSLVEQNHAGPNGRTITSEKLVE